MIPEAIRSNDPAVVSPLHCFYLPCAGDMQCVTAQDDRIRVEEKSNKLNFYLIWVICMRGRARQIQKEIITSTQPMAEQQEEEYHEFDDSDVDEEEEEGGEVIDISDIKSTPSKALRPSAFKDRVFILHAGII